MATIAIDKQKNTITITPYDYISTTMADSFDAHWDEASGFSAGNADGGGGGASYFAGGGSVASASANGGAGGVMEDEFRDEELGSVQGSVASRSSKPQSRRPPPGGRSGRSGRGGRSARGRSGRGPPPGGRSAAGRPGRSGRGGGRGRSGGRGPPPGRSGRGRSSRAPGGPGRGGRAPPPGRSGRLGSGRPPRNGPKQKKLPPGAKIGENGEIIGPNGELLDEDGKPKKNDRFQELEETGAWGQITRREKIVAGIILSLLIIGTILGVLFGVVLKDPETTTEYLPATPPPTAAPTLASDYRYELIKRASPNVAFPEDSTSLIGMGDRPASTSQFKAAEYMLHVDDSDLKPDDPRFIQKYALYVFYLETLGERWDRSDNWPTGPDMCEFYGIKCDYTQERVVKIELAQNNLGGMIPYEIVSLDGLIAIDVFGNSLEGELPYDAILDHPKLASLDVQDNLMSGIIPSSLAESKLDSFFIKGAGLEGNVPTDFCRKAQLVFVDCNENRCSQQICQSCEGPNCAA